MDQVSEQVSSDLKVCQNKKPSRLLYRNLCFGKKKRKLLNQLWNPLNVISEGNESRAIKVSG